MEGGVLYLVIKRYCLKLNQIIQEVLQEMFYFCSNHRYGKILIQFIFLYSDKWNRVSRLTCFSQFLNHGLYSSHNLIMADILCMYDFTHTLLKIFTAWKKVIINNLLHFIFCGCNKIRPYSYTFNGEPNGSFLCKKTYPCILKQYALAWCCIFKIVTF